MREKNLMLERCRLVKNVREKAVDWNMSVMFRKWTSGLERRGEIKQGTSSYSAIGDTVGLIQNLGVLLQEMSLVVIVASRLGHSEGPIATNMTIKQMTRIQMIGIILRKNHHAGRSLVVPIWDMEIAINKSLSRLASPKI